MNREIKFRAWDKVKKTFNRSIEIDCLGGMQEYKYTGSAYQAVYDVDMGGFSEANERFVLHQYTGLKDSEGVEIYEGDIVTIVNLEADCAMWTSFENGFTGQIQVGAGLKLCMVDENDEHFEHWDDGQNETGFEGFIGYTEEHVKVIGNVYETPDLCKNE